MKIYVASSWKNSRHTATVSALRAEGHTVYDYRNPAHGKWSETRRWWETATYQPVTFPVAVGDGPERKLAFKTDMDALRAADVVVLVLDSGKSSHLEAGFAAGAGKRLLVIGDASCEPELMYGMADLVTTDLGEVVRVLRAQAKAHAVAPPAADIPQAVSSWADAMKSWKGTGR